MLKKIISTVIVIVTILFAFIIQSTVVPMIRIGGIGPNLMLVLAASYGFLLGDRVGMFTGLLCGLITDIFFGPLIGFSGLVYALIGYLCGKFKSILYVEDISFPLLMVGLSDLFYCFLCYVFLFLFRNRLFFGLFFKTVIVPEMLYTMLVSIPIYPALGLLYVKFLRPVRRNPLAGTGASTGDGIVRVNYTEE